MTLDHLLMPERTPDLFDPTGKEHGIPVVTAFEISKKLYGSDHWAAKFRMQVGGQQRDDLEERQAVEGETDVSWHPPMLCRKLSVANRVKERPRSTLGQGVASSQGHQRMKYSNVLPRS